METDRTDIRRESEVLKRTSSSLVPSRAEGASGSSVLVREEKPEDIFEDEVRSVKQGWVKLALDNGFVPLLFVTLTFDESRLGTVSPERALSKWAWIVAILNRMTWGKSYKRRFKHSSFSYIVAVDFSKLGAVHLHAIIDGWIPLAELHRVWNHACGFAWVTKIKSSEDVRIAIAHVVKYATKGSDLVDWWFSKSPIRFKP